MKNSDSELRYNLLHMIIACSHYNAFPLNLYTVFHPFLKPTVSSKGAGSEVGGGPLPRSWCSLQTKPSKPSILPGRRNGTAFVCEG